MRPRLRPLPPTASASVGAISSNVRRSVIRQTLSRISCKDAKAQRGKEDRLREIVSFRRRPLHHVLHAEQGAAPEEVETAAEIHAPMVAVSVPADHDGR